MHIFFQKILLFFIHYFMSHQPYGLLATIKGGMVYMFLWCVSNILASSFRLSFRVCLMLNYFLCSRYTSHYSMRWSLVRVVLHRSQSGWSSLVNINLYAIFVCLIMILDITIWWRLFRVDGITFL